MTNSSEKLEEIFRIPEYIDFYHKDLVGKIENISVNDKDLCSLKCSILSLCIRAIMQANDFCKNEKYLTSMDEKEILSLAKHLDKTIEVLAGSITQEETRCLRGSLSEADNVLIDFAEDFHYAFTLDEDEDDE